MSLRARARAASSSSTGPPPPPPSPEVTAEEDDDAAGTGAAARVAKDSMSVAGWTAVSRVTGFGRVVAVAAVLGPTYLGNVFQATNNLPNLVYMALTGALISSLLVPPLVRLVDAGDRRGTERLAGAFLGVALLTFGLAAVLVVLAAPLVLRLFTVGVGDAAEAAGQRGAGQLLLLLCMPQLLLYAVAGTCEAVMNAHGRFALPSAAPTLENLGVISTMGATAVIFGTGAQATDVSTGQLVLMAGGSTASVAVHAAIQWWGVHRLGVRLVPRAGWREPAVREIIRKAVPSLGYSALDAGQRFGFVVVANRVAGGVVAFDLAMNFYVLPSALGARPVAVALLPQLARFHHRGQMARFRDGLVRGSSLMLFLAVPAAVGFAVLAGPISQSVTFGAMADAEGRALLHYALLGLSAGVVGECALLLATYVSYARGDVRSPVQAMVLRLVIAAAGVVVAVTVPTRPEEILLTLGLAVSAADLAGAAFLALRLRAALPQGRERLLPPVARTGVAAAGTAGAAAWAVAVVPTLLPGGGPRAGVLAACVLGAAVFLLVQALLRSPELKLLRQVVKRTGAVGVQR